MYFKQASVKYKFLQVFYDWYHCFITNPNRITRFLFMRPPSSLFATLLSIYENCNQCSSQSFLAIPKE